MEYEGAVANNQNDLPPRERTIIQGRLILERYLEQLRRRERILRLLMQGEVAMHRYLELERDGLTPERIERFQHFDANESMVGEQCLVCLDDLIVGKRMVRLDCHVDHYLCEKCALGWFKEHNTCPTCRHEFE